MGGPETGETFRRAKTRGKKATTLSMSVRDLLRLVKWRCETQCLRMIKHPKLASRSSSSSIRRLKKFRFNETFDIGFKTRIHSYIDSTYPTAYFDDFYDLHDEKKMITLAELKEKLKIYYHNTYYYIPQIIQNWSVYSRFCHVAPKKKKKSTLKYTLIGTPKKKKKKTPKKNPNWTPKKKKKKKKK